MTKTIDTANIWKGVRAEEPRMSDPRPSYYNAVGQLSPNRAAIEAYQRTFGMAAGDDWGSE